MTPFLTGRRHTLFFNDQITSGGVVGAAISTNSTTVKQSVEYPSLVPMGEVLNVTSARGNIILSLDGSNAARHLLQNLPAHVSSSSETERQLYLRVYPQQGTSSSTEIEQSDGMVYRIISGDPSKGSLAIDTINHVEPGMRVQFMYSEPSHSKIPPSTPSSPSSPSSSLRFITTHPDHVSSLSTTTPKADIGSGGEIEVDVHVSRCFEAASEGGFVAGSNSGPGSNGEVGDTTSSAVHGT
ncbi:hypothetical protein HK102_010795, partial [Quaeritorhiza haematococci]